MKINNPTWADYKTIEKFKGNDIVGDAVIYKNGQRQHISDIIYSKDWNYLMSVLEKINKEMPVLTLMDLDGNEDHIIEFFKLNLFSDYNMIFAYTVKVIEWLNEYQLKNK